MPTKKVILESRLKGANKTKQGLKGIDGGLKSLGKSAIGVAGAYFGARGLISGFSAAIRLAGEQELAERRLQVALGRTSKALLNQASALQQVTTFGDEAIIAQQAFLASLEFTEEQIMDIIPVALDLASATGMALESAVRNTAKTFSGLSGELGELIPQLRDLTSEQMKAGDAVKLLGELLEGQAAAQAETLVGRIEQAKNSLGDMGESIGELFAPAVIGLSGHIKDLSGFIQGGVDATGDMIMSLFDIEKQSEENIIDNEGLAISYDNLSASVNTAKKELSEYQKLQLTREKSLQDELAALLAQKAALEGANLERQYEIKWMGVLTPMQKLTIEQIEKTREEIRLLTEAKQDKNGITKTEIDLTEKHNVLLDRQILHMEKLAMIKAGMIVEDDKLSENQKDFIKFTGDLGKAMQGTSQLLATAAGDDVKRQIQAMRLSQFAAIANTAKEATKVLTNPLALAGVIATGAAQVLAIQNAIADAQSVKAAAFGANEIVSRPTLFLTGEAGPEHVQVTPLTAGMNQNGPQGGVTIQIQGNMIGNESFVRDTLIPEISKATNQGLA